MDYDWQESTETLSLTGWDVLYHSERLGKSAWSNQPIFGETKKLRELCRIVAPKTIVELGSRYCGTALALHDAAPEAHLFAFDYEFSIDDDLLVDLSLTNQLGYENKEFWPKRSWFPDHIEFINCDFVERHHLVKRMVNEVRKDPLFLFVDGGRFDKPMESSLYANWLVPGDVLAVNNFGDEWQLPQIEDTIIPMGFERYQFKWCEDVKLVLTRAWIRK